MTDPSTIVVSPIDAVWGSEADHTFHVVLVEPEIPPNTGSIARLCAATGAHLHLVEPLGFVLDDRHLKRAGLDYWPSVGLSVHRDFEAIEAIFPRERMVFFSSHGVRNYAAEPYAPGTVLVFGKETKGLGKKLIEKYADRVVWIPFRPGTVRSINLANAVSVALYEALRQADFPDLVR